MSSTNVAEILLVEDNQHDSTFFLRALKKSNMEKKVVLLKDGAEAFDYLFGDGDRTIPRAEILPKAIFLDINLPRINGFDVLKRVRKEKATRFIPVVIISSSREEGDIVTSYKLGANSYITKPVEYNEFITMAQQISTYWLLQNQIPL